MFGTLLFLSRKMKIYTYIYKCESVCINMYVNLASVETPPPHFPYQTDTTLTIQTDHSLLGCLYNTYTTLYQSTHKMEDLSDNLNFQVVI